MNQFLNSSFLILLLISFLYSPVGALNKTCVFHLKDLPIPKDPLLVGDVRKNKDCFETSFQETRPEFLSDPSGLRLWSREENSAMESTVKEVHDLAGGRMGESAFMYENYNVFVESHAPKGKHQRRIHKQSDEVLFQFIQIPKTGSTSMKAGFRSSYRSKSDLSPFAKQLNSTFTCVRFFNLKKNESEG